MTFYSTAVLDNPAPSLKDSERVHFKIEAESAHHAVGLLSAYLKGRFEGSGKGGDIESLSKTKTRGVEYRGL